MRLPVWLSLLLACVVLPRSAHPQSAATAAGDTAPKGGLIVHVGCGDGKLTAALPTSDRCLVHGLDADPKAVAEAREHIRSLGLYGQVTVDLFDGKGLPYVGSLVNVLVDSSDDGRVSSAECQRVLAPHGLVVAQRSSLDARRFDTSHWVPVSAEDIARLTPRLDGNAEWVAFRKSWPDELDEWTHWLHGPDNNAVSRDRKVDISRNLQWIMPPRWARHHNLLPSVSAMVSAGGRLYCIIDEGAISVRGLPDKWRLVARDAFNGLMLWKRPIENWGWRRWSDIEFSGVMRFKGPSQLFRRLVAVGDVVYVTLGFDQPIVAIDGATGKTLKTFAGTERTSEILYHNGRLLLARNSSVDVAGNDVLAVDTASGEILWEKTDFDGTTGHNDELNRYTDAYLTAGRENVFFIDGDDLVALEMASGKEVWRKPRPEMKKNVLGHYLFNHANLCTLVYHDGILLLGQMHPFPDNLNSRQQKAMVVRAIDSQTGETLWESPGMSLAHFTPPDLFVNDGLAWTMKINDVSLLGLDLRTGEVKKEYPVKDMLVGHHHRCYRNKATERFYLAGEEGIEYIDFRSGELDVHHWMRGACAYGIMPANGCIYLPTHSCGCHNNAKLNGFIALTAEGVPTEILEADRPVERGPAHPFVSPGDRASSEDWPVFKHDNGRSNHAPTDAPTDLSQRWTASIGGRPTPPVIADNRLFVASQDDHELHCLDATTGETVWRATTDGTLDTPPTVHEGRLLFGTRAGFVCALRADDGRLIWRFRAAPADVRLTSFGQLESPWPVHGSVVVIDGRVYCVAGRSMHLNGGLHAYVLDVNSGEVLQQVQLTANTDVKGEVNGAVLPDILVANGNSVYMRNLKLPADDITQYQASGDGSHLMPNDGGLLDDTWFNSAFWVYMKSRAQMLVHDEETVYGIQAYDKFIAKSYPHDIFTPGKGYRLFAASLERGKSNATPDRRGRKADKKAKTAVKWEHRIQTRALGMVVTNRHLCLAGTPDVVDKTNPWAALEGRHGSLLQVFDIQDGEQMAELPLDSVPVYDGMAAASGRIYMSLQDGRVVCYGK